MDLSKRKFKIVQNGTRFTVWAEVPKYKKRGVWPFRRAYYDEEDLQWAALNKYGDLHYRSVSGGPSAPTAQFNNVTSAQTFIKNIQSPPKIQETIVPAKEAKMVALKQNSK